MVGRKRKIVTEELIVRKRPRRSCRDSSSLIHEDENEEGLTSIISIKEEIMVNQTVEENCGAVENGYKLSENTPPISKSIGWNAVKIESYNSVNAGEVIAKIRRVTGEEMSKLHGSHKTGWVQECPYCDKEVGSLVDHIKSCHPDRDHRQIRTLCPFLECSKHVVDIKNHIRMVHDKVRNFSCHLCDATFTSNYQVKKHMEGVHSNRRVTCNECGDTFKTTTLESHKKRVHRGERPSLPCPGDECDKVFGSKADLERHYLGLHMKWKAPCPECGKKIRMECLPQHIQTVHKGIYPFNCDNCDQGFQNQKGLIHHVRSRHQGLFLLCRVVTKTGIECGKVMSTEDGLLAHVDNMHLEEGVIKTQCSPTVNMKGEIECPLKGCGYLVLSRKDVRLHVSSEHPDLSLDWCDDCVEICLDLTDHNRLTHSEIQKRQRAIFGVVRGTPCSWVGCKFMSTGDIQLARHVKLEHEQRKKAVKCDQCGKLTRDIKKHVRIKHEKIKTLVCDICDKLFLTKFILKKHKLTHSGDAAKPCPQCGVEVVQMKQHIRFVHNKDLPFSCDIPGCQTKFTSRLGLKNHVESVHDGLKVSCPFCEKMISSMSLKSHLKIVHEKRRDHVCTRCDKTFQAGSHLKNHIDRVHLKVRVECPECGKMVQDLHNHTQFVHKKVKNFPCDKCDRRCTTSTALNKHISSVHLGEKVECNECGETVAKVYIDQHNRRQHSGREKILHECAECNNTFTTKSYLAKHILRVHMEVRETCPKCGLKTKDLYRHSLYTDCGRDGYTRRTHRKVNIKNKEDDLEMKIGRNELDVESDTLLSDSTSDLIHLKTEELDLDVAVDPIYEEQFVTEEDNTTKLLIKKTLSSDNLSCADFQEDLSVKSVEDISSVSKSDCEVELDDDDLYFGQEEDCDFNNSNHLYVTDDPLLIIKKKVTVKSEIV